MHGKEAEDAALGGQEVQGYGVGDTGGGGA